MANPGSPQGGTPPGGAWQGLRRVMARRAGTRSQPQQTQPQPQPQAPTTPDASQSASPEQRVVKARSSRRWSTFVGALWFLFVFGLFVGGICYLWFQFAYLSYPGPTKFPTDQNLPVMTAPERTRSTFDDKAFEKYEAGKYLPISDGKVGYED